MRLKVILATISHRSLTVTAEKNCFLIEVFFFILKIFQLETNFYSFEKIFSYVEDEHKKEKNRAVALISLSLIRFEFISLLIRRK